MIQQLKIKDRENNHDIYKKIVVYLASDFSIFDSFTSDDDLTEMLKNLSILNQVLFVDLLPENITTSAVPKRKSGLVSWKINVKFTVPFLDSATQLVLQPFMAKKVFLVIEKSKHHKIYGSTKEPLTLFFEESDSNKPNVLNGFSVTVSGTITELPRFLSSETYSLIERQMAKELAAEI